MELLAMVALFGLFRLITVKGQAFKPIHYGRKWTAWMVLFGSMTTLPKFFRHLDTNSFAVWVAVTIPLGIMAFLAGLIYGKIAGPKKEEIPKMKENQTGADSTPSINKTHVSENDVLTKTNQEQDRVSQKPLDLNVEGAFLTKTIQTIPTAKLNEEDFYTQAWDEINDQNKTPNKATWAKAFSISQGDEKKTQAKYIELRVAQLQKEHEVRLLKLKAEQEQVAEIATAEVEEKARAEADEKAMVEAKKKTIEKKDIELRVLAKKALATQYVDDAKDLIIKLGGAWQSDDRWFSRNHVKVILWDKTHEFSEPADCVTWVIKDIVPRVLYEPEKVEKNAT